jgi:dTDP-4-amino-4,6-dideoxygalactose transaminase
MHSNGTDLAAVGGSLRYSKDLALFGGPRAVPRSTPTPVWPIVTADDEAAVAGVLRSRKFTSATRGENEVSRLERDWATAAGVPHAVAVSSGTAGLALALAAAGVRQGDEVIVPALSFIATAVAPLHIGAIPAFADIDPWTFNLDPDAAEAAITPRTRAIIAVHLHGLAANMERIQSLAHRHGLTTIEDAAQAFGATCAGRPVASFGAAAVFSLNVSKNVPTCGEGGLVTSSDAAIAERVTRLRQFGERIVEGEERLYLSDIPGWNHKMNAIQAAFTRSQLARAAAYARARERQVTDFLRRLERLPGLVVPGCPPGWTHAWHILRFRFDPAAWGLEGLSPGAFRSAMQRLLRAEGVPLSHYQVVPLPGQPAFDTARWPVRGWPGKPPDRTYRLEDFPVACAVIEDSLTLQKAHLPPDSGNLLRLYGDAFEKVWQYRDIAASLARSLSYAPPWEHAKRSIAERV